MSDREHATSVEVVTSVLEMARSNGGWNDEVVAIDVLLNLGIDPSQVAPNPWNADPELGAKEFMAKRDEVMIDLANKRQVLSLDEAKARADAAEADAKRKTDAEAIAEMDRKRREDAEAERRREDEAEARVKNEDAEKQAAQDRIDAARKQAEQDEADKLAADEEAKRQADEAQAKLDQIEADKQAAEADAAEKLRSDAETEAKAKADADAAKPTVDGARGDPNQKTTIASSDDAKPVAPSSEATPDAHPSAPVPPPPAWAGEGKPIEETGSKQASDTGGKAV